MPVEMRGSIVRQLGRADLWYASYDDMTYYLQVMMIEPIVCRL